MMRKLIAAVALAMAAPAAAQDGSEESQARTPEGAQAFLASFLDRGGWAGRAYNWFDGSTYRYFDGTRWHDASVRFQPDFRGPFVPMIEAVVAKFEAVDACTSVVRAQSPRTIPRYLEESSLAVAARDLTVKIDWRNVDPVQLKQDDALSKIDGSVVRTHRFTIPVWDPKSRSGIILVHSDKATAERAAFALSFLQSRCDPTAGGPF